MSRNYAVEVASLIREVERLRALAEAVFDVLEPACNCDHYSRNACPCARARKLIGES